jgi:isopenicillin-N epimerase
VDARRHFLLDPTVTYLNHGSFGACPRPVLEAQSRLRERIERHPVLFLARELPSLLDPARAALAAFVGAGPDDLAFVPNATTGVNTVLRSLRLAPGDELLTTDHGYQACRNALAWVAERTGARVVTARVPFPLEDDAQIIEAVLGAVTPRTRLALLDHVSSPTGLVFPVRRLVAALEAAGVDCLIDGAHAPGMLPLDVAGLDAAYYVGNCHKWLCAPRGAAFLVARQDRQADLVPLTISHGYSQPLDGRSRFRLLFDWTGTDDPTPYLCVPEAIAAVGGLVDGGWPAIMARNHALTLAARELLAGRLGLPPAAPASSLGSLYAVPLGEGDPEALQARLFDEHRIELPVYGWPTPSARVMRLSLAVYTELSEVQRLAEVLPAALAAAG